MWDAIIDMTIPTSARGVVTTINATSYGPLMDYLAERRGCDIVMAQETQCGR